MAKSDNFLRGWCRQLREALDEGTELGYESAELLEECLDLLVPDRDTGPEMEQSDDRDGDSPEGPLEGPLDGTVETDQPGVPGLERRLNDALFPRGVDNEAGVPRGTRGPVVKRRERAK